MGFERVLRNGPRVCRLDLTDRRNRVKVFEQKCLLKIVFDRMLDRYGA